MYRTHKGRLEFKTPCRLQCLRSTDSVLTGGQMSDYKGPPVLLLCHRPRNSWRIEAMMPTSCECLSSKGITPCIPGRYSRKAPVAYDKELYK